VQPSRPLMPAALEIAARAGRSVHDALYLAVAVLHRCPLVTADQKLCRALRTSPMAPPLTWVGDVG
jgi:predicted nucleic acid-binding protein